jgi:hypothetical protein
MPILRWKEVMRRNVKVLFWIETAIASLSGSLFVLTLIRRDWIEGVFGWDPDQHNGSVEWVIVGALLVVALVFGRLARANWRRLATA